MATGGPGSGRDYRKRIISVVVCNAYSGAIRVRFGGHSIVERGGGIGIETAGIAVHGTVNISHEYDIQRIGIGFTEIGSGKRKLFKPSTATAYLTIRTVNKHLCEDLVIERSSNYIVDAKGQIIRGSKKPNYWIDMDGVNHKASVGLIAEIPDNIRLTKAYTDAIKDGVEQSKTVRVMLIGNGGVGKSSLTANLIDDLQLKSTSQIEPLSTDGSVVHTCTTLKSSDLWKILEGTAIDVDADRLARLRQQQKNNNDQPTSQNNSIVKPNVLKQQQANVFEKASTESDKNLKTSEATVRRIKDVEEYGEKGQRFVKIWDLCGQFVYYATQLFHSQHAVYLLVLDASMQLDDIVKYQYPDKISIRTVKQYCKFWMNSIQSYVGTENGNVPPVILVATHIDAVEGGWNPEKENDFFESVREIFDNTIVLNHIQPKSFALCNKEPNSEKFKLLREYIMEVADKQKSMLKLFQPARWIALETTIMKCTGQRYISFDELCNLDLKNELPIRKQDQLLAFLKLQHSLGELVYFDDDGLSDTIVVDPQWIIDAFMSIITSKMCCHTNINILPKWKGLVEEAKLSNDLIDFVWNEEKNQDFKDNKEKLLRYMSKLGILSKVCEVDIDTGDVRDCDFYMVPSLLHTHMPGDILEKALKSGTGTCTETTTSLVFAFDNKYISPTLYHRITAAALGQWNVLVSNEKRILYDNFGVYELDSVHYGMIELRDTSIDIRVMKRCKGEINAKHSDHLRRFVKRVIQNEYDRSGISPAKLYTEHIRCNLTNVGGANTKPSSELVNCEYKSLRCPDNTVGHSLDVPIVQKEWQLLNLNKMEITCNSLGNKESVEQLLTEHEIIKVASAIDRNWQVLGISLGLTEEEIATIERENDARLQIVNMLKKWSEKEGNKATIAALINQIKDTKYSGVDWDMINNILDKKGEKCYETRGKKGMLIILNSTENRKGTHGDVDEFRLFFKDTLGFDIHDPQQKLTYDETIKNAREVLNGDKAKTYYCLICVILSHGNKASMTMKDGELKVNVDIRENFSNDKMPKFAGRPKLFFVQSCKERDIQISKKVVDDAEYDTNYQDKKVVDESDVNMIHIPNEADTLIAYATTPGQIFTESLFITECMDEFRKEWKNYHVEDMLITMREKVALSRNSPTLSVCRQQMPCVWSTMTKRLYLAKDNLLHENMARHDLNEKQKTDEKCDAALERDKWMALVQILAKKLSTKCSDYNSTLSVNEKELLNQAEKFKVGDSDVAKRTAIHTVEVPDVDDKMLRRGRECYDTRDKKGMLLILNFAKNREGTQADVDKLWSFFGDTLGFEVRDPRKDSKTEDLTSKETKTCLTEAQKSLNGEKSNTYYCFICVILSHGSEGKIITKNKGHLNVEEEIRMEFSNEKMPQFKGRPKLFFVQSCRGNKKQTCVDKPDDATEETEEIKEDESEYNMIEIPNEADTLMAYPTTFGHYSYRRTSGDTKGSWFIIECMKELRDNWQNRHVEDMFITVRDRVAIDWISKDDRGNLIKQMPCVWSTLTKRLYLAKDST